MSCMRTHARCLLQAAAASANSLAASIAEAASSPASVLSGGGLHPNPQGPLQGLQPHFGTRAASALADSVANAAAGSLSGLGLHGVRLPDLGFDLGFDGAALRDTAAAAGAAAAAAPAALAAALALWTPDQALAAAAAAAAAYLAGLPDAGMCAQEAHVHVGLPAGI